jgi:hypothetical protein
MQLPPPAHRRRSLTLPLPPAWLLSNLVILALIAGAAWADREYWHWYSPTEELTRQSQGLETQGERLDELESTLQAVSDKADDTFITANRLDRSASVAPDSDKPALARLANALALVSLVQSHGGSQTTTSAQGKACIAWLLDGSGSVTDCGFQRAN